MTINRLGALATLFALSTGLSHAQIKKTGSGYLLRVKYTKGQVIKLNSTNSVSGVQGRNGKFVVDLPMVIRVTATAKNSATLDLTAGPAQMGGKPVGMAPQNATLHVNNLNQAVDGEATNGLGASYPKDPVRLGAKWKASLPINSGSGQMTLDATYTFKGVKTVGGRQLAILTMTLAGAATGTGSMTLRMSDGTVNSSNMTLKMVVGTSPLSITSTITRKG